MVLMGTNFGGMYHGLNSSPRRLTSLLDWDAKETDELPPPPCFLGSLPQWFWNTPDDLTQIFKMTTSSSVPLFKTSNYLFSVLLGCPAGGGPLGRPTSCWVTLFIECASCQRAFGDTPYWHLLKKKKRKKRNPSTGWESP